MTRFFGNFYLRLTRFKLRIQKHVLFTYLEVFERIGCYVVLSSISTIKPAGNSSICFSIQCKLNNNTTIYLKQIKRSAR